MSKQMVLVARTNKVGSDSECGLGILRTNGIN